MNLNEKIIAKAAGLLLLIFGLAIIIYNIKSGYKSFGLYFIPMIFVIMPLSFIFKNYISVWFNSKKMIKPKRWINERSCFVFFILPLSMFSAIGFLLLFFANKLKWDVDLPGWITISLFAFLPLYLIYGLIFGFSVSEKQQRQIEERQKKLYSDDKGLTIEMPLLDKNCFISWQFIDAVIYYNYIAGSDFTEHYEGYKLYLNTTPVYIKYENQWWLNKLFSKNAQSKIIDINKETKHFLEIPKIIEKHLNVKVDITFSNPMKGLLISTQTHQTKNKITTIEKWKPGNNKPEQIVFDKFNRSIEEIKKNYR